METGIDKYVALLLYDYDCVVIPHLGGFVGNYRPARIDEKAGIAYPPGKDIRFNKNLNKNDGLLVNTVAQLEQLSYEEAGELVRASAEACLEALSTGGRLSFRKIGILYTDENRNLRFEPSHEQNYYRGSFGLEPFALPKAAVKALTIDQQSAEQSPPEKPKVEPKEETKVITLIPQEVNVPRYGTFYRVAAAALLPFVGLSLYLGISTEFKSPTQLTFADVNPFYKQKKIPSAYSERVVHETHIDVMPGTAIVWPLEAPFRFSFITDSLDSEGIWVNPNTASTPTVSASASATSGKYHIIAGCFGSKKNAAKFIDQMKAKGHQCQILDHHNGLYRVSLESHAGYGEAAGRLAEVRNRKELSEAWILRKQMP